MVFNSYHIISGNIIIIVKTHSIIVCAFESKTSTATSINNNDIYIDTDQKVFTNTTNTNSSIRKIITKKQVLNQE